MTQLTDRLRRSPALPISIVLLIVIYAVGVAEIAGFGSQSTIRAVLLLSSFLGLAAAGQTLVILIGGIDLSIPFVVGAANVAVAQLAGKGVSFILACLIVIAGAALVGALNALISVRCRVHPLLITLGTGTALVGLVQWWTKGLPVGGAPNWLSSFVSIGANTGPIPVAPVVILWLVVAILFVFMLRRTVFGRRAYALGSAPEAARLALIRPQRIWTTAFAISAALAAVAGILQLGFSGSADASVGNSYLFLSVGAVVIGGTAIGGGTGGYAGTIVGALTLTLLTTVFAGLGLGDALQQTVLGAAIIVLVAAYGRRGHVRARI
jgi:ribose transport system permease protein